MVRSNIESTLQYPQLVSQLDNFVISVISGLLATCDIHTQFANTQHAQTDRQTDTNTDVPPAPMRTLVELSTDLPIVLKIFGSHQHDAKPLLLGPCRPTAAVDIHLGQ